MRDTNLLHGRYKLQNAKYHFKIRMLNFKDRFVLYLFTRLEKIDDAVARASALRARELLDQRDTSKMICDVGDELAAASMSRNQSALTRGGSADVDVRSASAPREQQALSLMQTPEELERALKKNLATKIFGYLARCVE